MYNTANLLYWLLAQMLKLPGTKNGTKRIKNGTRQKIKLNKINMYRGFIIPKNLGR